MMLTNPMAFKTRSRRNEDGILLGVDPPLNITSVLHYVAIYLKHEDEPDE